jgi:Xaa-Pro aminopeptidase
VQYTEVPIAAGNVISDGEYIFYCCHSSQLITDIEPGYYEDGKFGIRIESEYIPSKGKLNHANHLCTDVVMAREVKTPNNFGDKQWLGFEHVTMTPIGRNLIEPSLLSDAELKWVNDYHAEIWAKTEHFFQADDLTRSWLERETQPISK